MSFTIKTEGFADIEKSLSAIESQLTRRNVAIRALTKGGEPIRADASRNAPKDKGDLDTSIKISPRAALNGRKTRRGGAGGEFGDVVEVFIGIDTSINRRLRIYAAIQENGSESNAAQPYIRPAFDAHGRNAVSTIKNELTIEVSKTVQRAAAKKARLKG